MFYKDERIALFIDGAELHRASEQLDFRVDFQKLHREFQRKGRLIAACYYAAVGDKSEYAGVHKLHDWLSYNGYRLHTKPLKEHEDSNGQHRTKANMKVEITVDALELAPRLDHAIIFSGSEELVPLVKGLHRSGVRVTIVSTRQTSPRMVSDELRREADTFIEIDDLIDVIGQTREAVTAP